MKIAVCDTSSLIKLNKVDALDILGKLFDRICLPYGVKEECLDDRLAGGLKKPFFEIRTVKNVLPIGMGKGEREAISLAVELNLKTLIVDDIKAFKEAEKLNLFPLNTERVLVLAKRANVIGSVKSVLDSMRNAGEGIEDEVYLETLRLAGEQ